MRNIIEAIVESENYERDYGTVKDEFDRIYDPDEYYYGEEDEEDYRIW